MLIRFDISAWLGEISSGKGFEDFSSANQCVASMQVRYPTPSKAETIGARMTENDMSLDNWPCACQHMVVGEG